MLDMNHVVGTANILFVTFDCLRYDVAKTCFDAARTKPSMLPRRCSELPPQLPQESSGTVIMSQFAEWSR